MTRVAPPKLFKSIFQARYEPKLSFYPRLAEAAAKLDEYPHWRTNAMEVTLRDPDKHCSLAIKHKLFAYTQDSGDLDLEQRYMGRALEELPPALGLQAFTRLGFLRRYLIPVAMDLESLISVMSVKLLSQDDRLREILPPRLEDLMYRIDSADEKHRYHIAVGPVQKAQIPQLIDFNTQDHVAPENADEIMRSIHASYPDVAIFFDIDFYHSGELPIADAAEFIETGRSTVHRLVSNLGEYILSTKVEA